jgi:predicted permease
VTQIAATVVLLTGAGLLVRSLGKLTQVDTGFDRRNLLLVRVDPSASRLDGRPAAEWGSQLSERVRALPGVRSVALAANTVFTGRESWIRTAWVDGYSYAPGERQTVGYNEVGPGFFATAGILLLAGREFVPSDRPGMPEVAIVNHAFARKYFGDRDPVGHRFGTRGDAITRYEIVGVTVDTKIESLHEAPWPAIYLPLLQQERHGPLVLHVRGSASVTALAPAVRRAVAGVDPDLEIRRVNTLDVAVGETLRGERMLATLLALFAAVTLLLTAVGLYGSMAYAATRRTAEIGIRMALGASEGRICAWMLREASFVLAAGALVGVTVAALALGSLRSLLFQVGTWDPISFGAALLSVVVVGLAAAVLPARRAARRPPMIALRHE